MIFQSEIHNRKRIILRRFTHCQRSHISNCIETRPRLSNNSSFLPVVDSGNTGSGNEYATDPISETLVVTDPDGLTGKDSNGTNYTIFKISSQPNNGAAAIVEEVPNNPASLKWTYKPKDNFSGEDSFEISITDDNGGISYETISVNIAAGNDPTEISGDITSTGNEDNQLKGVITLSDIDGLTNGSIVAISSTTSKQPQRGEAVIAMKGKDNSGNLTAEWTYTPQDNVHGDDQFTVIVTDDAGFSHEEVIKVTITSVDDKPLVSSGIYASAEKGARNENNTAYQMIQGAYLATDTDTTTNTYSPVLLYSGGSNGPANGTVSAGVNNIWSYTPTNPTNNDQFTVSVRDNEGNETEQVINLSFYHVDTEATFQASEVTISGSEDSTLSGNITIQDTDGLNTEKLAVTQVSPTLTGLTLKDPVKGSNTTTASIAWEYKPDATSSDNTEGNLSFTIEVNDDLGGTTSQVVNLIRYPINEVATASQGQSAATSVGSTAKATGTLILNDPDDNNKNTINTYALVIVNLKMVRQYQWKRMAMEYTPTGEQGYDYFLAKRTDKRGFETVQAINLYLGETAAATNLISGDVSGTAKYDSTSPPNITGSLGTESITGTFEIIDEDSTKAGSQSRKGAAVSITNTGEWTYTPATDFSNGNDFFLVKFTQNITGTETIQAVNIFIPVDTPTLITSTTSVEIQEIRDARGRHHGQRQQR